MKVDGRTPVLVGCAQYIQKCDPEEAQGPAAMLSDVAQRAADDTGKGAAALKAVDTLTVIQSTTSESGFQAFPVGHLNDPPKTVAGALGIAPKDMFSTATGGNTPQMLVNRFADDIAAGKRDAVMLIGGEVLHSMFKQIRAGKDMRHWGDGADPIGADRVLGEDKPGVNGIEEAHGLGFPTNTYPLFENALRSHYGRSIEEHQRKLGELMAPFSSVAAHNPYAWFPTARSPAEISTEGPDNRWVGFPYTKFLNSIILVDQGAAVVMMSAEKAANLGIDQSKWIYLHGCADVNDTWHVLNRLDFHSSPAIRLMGERGFTMAGWRVQDLDFIDLYSCFPSAVEIACDELGLAHNDPRGLTVTGGLPYFGGAGNAYSLCAIAEMMTRLRDKPKSKGLVTANGWFVTKHSMGLYSSQPVYGRWRRDDPKDLQSIIEAKTYPTFAEHPSGKGRIETYTVIHARDKVRMGIVIGRLENGERFVAHVPHDEGLFKRMKTEDFIGRTGTVTSGKPTNFFNPDA